MADLGIFDIVALSKAGYKKKDIDAIIAGEKDKPFEPQGEAEPTPKTLPSTDPEPQPQDAEVEPQTEGKTEETPDYKSLYESLKAEGLKQAQTIKDLQAKINNQDRTETKVNPMDDLMKSFRNFS